MKRIVIVGASSGIGMRVAQLLIKRGDRVAVAARRVDRLQSLHDLAPDCVVTAALDVNDESAPARLQDMIQQLGGMDIYLHVAGVGWRNNALEPDIELNTMQTNGLGFTRMVGEAYRYFAEQGRGHIVCITSIAGTKGLGAAPAYSATKAMQNTYLEALHQQAHARHLDIRFTDVRPGFVQTDLLNDGNSYPLLMSPDRVARSVVSALDRRKGVAVIDGRWGVITWVWRHLVPHWLWWRLPIGIQADK